jgi:hypothetical protein
MEKYNTFPVKGQADHHAASQGFAIEFVLQTLLFSGILQV